MEIIGALDRLGPKVSTEEMSDLLAIPARTVRYRLKRLREIGVLGPACIMTLERKLGLGETIFLVDATPKGIELLPKVFHVIDTIYSNSPTYGKYNGYLAFSLYSLSSPHVTRRILEELQKEELVTNFFIFDITDFDYKPADYSYFNSRLGWVWDWSRWVDQFEEILRSKERFEFSMEEVQSIAEFDKYDIFILKEMFDDGEITQKKLANILGLSETLVNKRIRRLEDEGIIKGYKSTVYSTENEINLICFIELEQLEDPVLAAFYKIPFPATFTMESRTRFAIQLSLNAQNLTGFLKGLDVLRPHLVSCFVQTVHDSKMSMDSHPYHLFNVKSNRWETPESEYLQDIRNVLTGKE